MSNLQFATAYPKILKRKIKSWIYRYLPAELAGVIMAFTCSYLVGHFTHRPILLAYAASLGDNTGFYGAIILRDSLAARKLRLQEGRSYVFRDSTRIARNMILEFGGAELLDSICIRPFFMYLFPHLLGKENAGILYGKIASDIVFYGTMIVSYEIRKHFSRKD
jgi:hypothetical protein